MTQQQANAGSRPDGCVVIAVMGATGSGKSTLINLLSGSNLVVGEGLRSCTAAIGNSDIFELDGCSVMLIDTPGFNDTTKSDTDILKLISTYMATAYEAGVRLSGVLYLHRISDNRMGGTSLKNFQMFRKLCGDSMLPNVVIVTTMWGLVDPGVGNRREQELKTDELFLKPVLEKGAQLVRHDNTLQSAQAILRCLAQKQPKALRIQEELIEERKTLPQTEAGAELAAELRDMMRKHEEEMMELQQEMAEAQATKDREAQMELAREREVHAKKLRDAEEARERMSRAFASAAVNPMKEFWDGFMAGYRSCPTIFSVVGMAAGTLSSTAGAAGVAVAVIGALVCWIIAS